MADFKSTGPVITGRGGGKSDDGGRAYYHQPDTISSHATGRMTMVLAAGPIEGLADGAASIYFDGVPLATGEDLNFRDIAWQITRGTADQPPLGLEGFNAIEDTVRLNRRLLYGIPYQMARSADAVRVTFRFPRGLVHQNESGIFGARVELLLERRRPDGIWQPLRTVAIAEKQTSGFDFQVLIPLEANAEDEALPAIRLTRLTPAAEDPLVRDEIDILALTWLRWERLSYPGVSLLGLSFDAASFAGKIPRIALDLKGRVIRLPVNYNPASRTSIGLWNGRFKHAWSNNPAWVLFDLLTNRDWGLGLADTLIDVFDLHAIAAYCDEAVSDGTGGDEPRFQFDGVITRRQSASEVIGQLCAAIRVHYFWSGGRMRFIQDRPGDPVMVLTNALVEAGVFVYSGPSMTAGFSHALVSFADAESETGISVETEINPPFLARHGYRAREVALPGCRRRSQARRHARWLVETARRDLYGIAWHASLDHFAENPIRPGDIIRIYDSNRIAGAVCPGRITAVSEGLLKAEISSVISAGEHRSARLSYEAISQLWVENIEARITHHQDGEVTLTPVLADWAEPPRPGGAMLLALEEGRETGIDYRVIQVREVDKHRLEVNAIRHDPDLYERVDHGFGLDDLPRPARPAFDQPLPLAENLVLHQPKSLPHGGDGRDLHISWDGGVDPRIAFWRLEATGPGGERQQRDVPRPPLVLMALAPGEWRLRLRAVDWTGREGPLTTALVEITPDAGSADLPEAIQITPGYGQLIITWDRRNLPASAAVEVIEYPERGATVPLSHVATFGAVHILPGRSPGQPAFFRLRTRLAGGTPSVLSPWLAAAALALPESQTAERAPKIIARAVTTARWTKAEARKALGEEDPITGDLVTLYRPAASGTPWAETRRYDGSAWVASGPVISGEVLAPLTLPASRLKIDPEQLEVQGEEDRLAIKAISADLITSGVLQSSDYAAGATGFSIDTSGSAEFNNALIRGVLEGSTIKSSLLVASTFTVPTEAGGRFLTLERPRPLRYASRNINGTVLAIGPLQVADDDQSKFLGDRHNIILAADDRHGDTPTGENTYYSRFWSHTPQFKITLKHIFTARRWGELVSRGRITVVMRTVSGRQLARSGVLTVDTLSSWRQPNHAYRSWLLPLSGGFSAGSRFTLSREVVKETSGQRRHYTRSLTITATLGCRFSHDDNTAANDGLVAEFHLDFSGNGTLSSQPINGFYRSIDLEGTTYD